MSYFQPINRNEINEIGDLVELGQDASPTQKTSMFQQLETRISFASLFNGSYNYEPSQIWLTVLSKELKVIPYISIIKCSNLISYRQLQYQNIRDVMNGQFNCQSNSIINCYNINQ